MKNGNYRKMASMVLLLVAGITAGTLSPNASAEGLYPEDGWWWSSGPSGRAWFIERQQDIMFVVSVHYANTGEPEWLSAVGSFTAAQGDSIGNYVGKVFHSTDGQCIGCTAVDPLTVESEQGPLTIQFSDTQHATLNWSGEELEIHRTMWLWADAVDQLSGTWIFTQVEGGNPLSQFVIIDAAEGSGFAAISNAITGAAVGSVELLDGDLVLSLTNASESVLPLIMPGAKRFYAGYRDGTTLQVTGVQVEDMPLFLSKENSGSTGLNVDNFLDGALAEAVTTQDCTLSGGEAASCYRITVAGHPAGRETGPFCPDTITDGAEAGGIWFDGDAVYNLDGQFFVDLATTYGDNNWHMYDAQGNVNVTETAEEFEAAARPNVDPALQNHCVEGRLEWLTNGVPITTTVLIPVTPVAAASSTQTQGNHGVSLDGVVIAASAPVHAILGAYTIAAFDDCGGHYNPHDGYHMHGAVGCSEVGGAAADDTPIFGYALDGYAIHSPFEAGEAPAGLDVCNGHTTAADGYHYHANSAAQNQVLQCLMGQTAVAGT